MTHFVKINGKTVEMKNAKFEYLPGGRRIRRWHRFVTGLIDGVLKTVCLGIALIANVIAEIGADIARRIEQQRMLMDARVLRTRAC